MITVNIVTPHLQALCAEASLAALRRVYPQIYDSDVKLLIDPAAVVVTRQDFLGAMQGVLLLLLLAAVPVIRCQ